MIADGIIPFLVYDYGEEALQFFDLEVVAEKAEWKWDSVKKTIINPLSREMDELEIVDNDYDFSVAFNAEVNKTAESTNTTNKE